ncbi:N-carbamoyl-L-amino acid hydrolase [Cercophora scortea]|uniref:N-carbamoyl-L-amino acid hydrolase n=1 Tax=Cercophora scortea TaxID=314031 RepID=A0AAE0MGH9_9PEZI|nr:N-carbamoyl-L-amino acid hydrolase [Cercophora scortea]
MASRFAVSPIPRLLIRNPKRCQPPSRDIHKRLLSTTAPTRAATTTTNRWKPIDDATLQTLKVNQTRLLSDLHHTCQWGTGQPWGPRAKPTETGMSRLALSGADKLARDWFVDTTKALGCNVSVDAMGNIFAVRPGRRDGSANAPPTCAGSHLDTQPMGGRYDGILGVVAGVEMLRVLEENGVETAFPVGVVNWTNEEGARFPISMVSSGVWAGEIPLERAHSLREVGGGTATMRSELERIKYLEPMAASHEAMPLAAHFELHIEQGPVLEGEKQKIGIVEGVQAYRWFTVEVVGRGAHTGTTPFPARADAMLAAARMIALSHDIATQHAGGLASTGILTLRPGSVNTIPSTVTFSLDIRAPRDSTLDTMESEMKRAFARIASKDVTRALDLAVNWQTDSVSPAVHFHEDCISVVEDAAASVLGNAGLSRRMVSGAGHDSVYTSRRCPTGMIFVPSRNGVSHHPEEYTSPEDCAIGAEVLMQSVLRYDRLRARCL